MAKIVKVLDIPVRYNNVTHQPNEEFEMADEHVNLTIVEVVGDVVKKPRTSKATPTEGNKE